MRVGKRKKQQDDADRVLFKVLNRCF